MPEGRCTPSTASTAAKLIVGSRFSARVDEISGTARLTGVPSARWVVLSPHLDDAVLSCGNLLTALRPGPGTGQDLRVETFFTECADPPTLSARAFLRQCGARSAAALYADRRAEDADVLSAQGVPFTHHGLQDALFRQRRGGRLRSAAGRALPELCHVYPTYRWHVARGVVSPVDAAVAHVEHVVNGLAAAGPGTILLAPLGVGSHVDHVLVRDAAARSGAVVVYYADVPYTSSHAPDRDFSTQHDLVRVVLPARPAKRDLVQGYRTQAAALFPTGVPELVDEFHVPRPWLERST